MAWDLEGKVAIVTGCASGIGLTTTRLYLEAGATVFGIDVSPFPDPFPFSQQLAAKFHFHRADLTAAGACDDSIALCLSKIGKSVDILANVAGIMDAFEAVHNVKDSTWDRLLSVNTTVPMKMMRAVLNQGGMLDRKSGRIINVASKAGIGGAAAGFAYTARVPTNIKSSIQKDNLDQESLDTLLPFHRLNHAREGGQSIAAEDIANATLFLSVEASRMINGVVVPVDNAWSAC